jgi:hypothetical protein
MMGLEKSNAVRFDELQRALRLALELRELPLGSAMQKRHALQGLTSLVNAQVGLWVYVDGMSTGIATLRKDVDVGWSGDAERNAYLSYVDHDQFISADPALAPLARLSQGPLHTAVREQLLDDAAWYGSDHVQRCRRAAGVDSFIYAT